MAMVRVVGVQRGRDSESFGPVLLSLFISRFVLNHGWRYNVRIGVHDRWTGDEYMTLRQGFGYLCSPYFSVALNAL